jgi:hypothetical protein
VGSGIVERAVSLVINRRDARGEACVGCARMPRRSSLCVWTCSITIGNAHSLLVLVDWLNLRRNLSVGSCCVEHSAKIFEGRKFGATSTRFLIS